MKLHGDVCVCVKNHSDYLVLKLILTETNSSREKGEKKKKQELSCVKSHDCDFINMSLKQNVLRM